jgi:hypothetical protein
MKTTILLLTLMTIISCGKKENLPERDKFGNRIFYNNLDYFKYTSSGKKIEPVVIIDTLCINQKAKAIKDIQNNQLTYHTGWTPHEKELATELKKYGIKLKPLSIYTGCLTTQFGLQCYENEMNEELRKRYGEDFFITLWNNTLEDHVKKFPHETFNEEGETIKLKDIYKSLMKKNSA